MQHATAYSDLDTPEDFNPTPEEIEAVSASILPHLGRNPDVWHAAVADGLSNDKIDGFGKAMADGRWADAGLMAQEYAEQAIAEQAKDLAERWFYDNFSKHERGLLAEWRPVKYASLGKRYHLAEMLP